MTGCSGIWVALFLSLHQAQTAHVYKQTDGKERAMAVINSFIRLEHNCRGVVF